ncbi:MAG: RES domain-containing protein [Nitrospira sp.]|nr:RES domain-containing protein [Nitrospira sp.]
MTQENDTVRVCHDCIGDSFLADEVKEKGHRGLCSYCGKRRKALTLEELAERIHEVLQEHFKLTLNETPWRRSGYPVADLIANMAGLDEEIAEDVRALLSEPHEYEAMTNGAENPYDSDAHYEEYRPDELGFIETWDAVRREIRSRSRFFSTSAEDALRSIFGNLNTLRTSDDQPVIRKITPDGEERFIWRARTAQSTRGLKDILGAPVREIGPPTSRLAKVGRMNAAGIPVFYGALDEDTCVAEVRAPVGSYVVVAKFEVLRPLRLLDFDSLTKIYVERNHFDPTYASHVGHASFLRRLVREMSRPIMPGDEAFEYLVTQAVAEYLAHKIEPRLDGIIFHSSQTDGTGRNVVLFNHACGVEPYDLPIGAELTFSGLPKVTKLTFFSHLSDEDDKDYAVPDITVCETMPSEPSEKVSPTERPESPIDIRPLGVFDSTLPWDEDESEEDSEPPTYASPTLRLDMESVVVLDIKGVQYNSKRRNVHRYRSTKGES